MLCVWGHSLKCLWLTGLSGRLPSSCFLFFFPLLFICFSLEEDGRSEVVMSPAYVSIKTALCSAKTSSLQTSEDSSTVMTRSCRGGETQATAVFPSCSQEPTFDELYFERRITVQSEKKDIWPRPRVRKMSWGHFIRYSAPNQLITWQQLITTISGVHKKKSLHIHSPISLLRYPLLAKCT